MTVDELINNPSPTLTFVQPKGADGSADHAICIVNDLVFDPKYNVALKLCMETIHFVCGRQGFQELGMVLRFEHPESVPKRKHLHFGSRRGRRHKNLSH